jgi:hypothetical protein
MRSSKNIMLAAYIEGGRKICAETLLIGGTINEGSYAKKGMLSAYTVYRKKVSLSAQSALP